MDEEKIVPIHAKTKAKAEGTGTGKDIRTHFIVEGDLEPFIKNAVSEILLGLTGNPVVTYSE